MKPILLYVEDDRTCREYARMLELELCDRGVEIRPEEDPGRAPRENETPATAVWVGKRLDPRSAKRAARWRAAIGVPVFFCAEEALMSAPNGVLYVERPLGAAAFCDSLAELSAGAGPSAAKERTEPLPGLILNRTLRTATCRGEPIFLTPREWAILERLDSDRGEPVSREELIRSARGPVPGRGSNEIDVYIRRLRKKIDERFEVRYLIAVRGEGYLLRRDPV